jgi:hypothetical protein
LNWSRDLAQYAAWLEGVPWQLFCTFTFAWPVSDMQADRVFHEFIVRLETRIRGPIAYVRGDEKRFSGCGKPGAPRHFHALIGAHRQLHCQWVAEEWMRLAGRRKNGAGADVRVYNAGGGALPYCLKFIHTPRGDWAFANLDIFLEPLKLDEMNKRQRRRLRRHRDRVDRVQ